ncbi:MAG: hypothetical protein ABW019_02435 [Chitinophagaceae bacterium]
MKVNLPGSPVVHNNDITVQKKAMIDALALEILYAQYEVEQLQAIVTSLSDKQSGCQRFLAAAGSARTMAYNNSVLGDQVIQSALDLRENADTAFNEAVPAASKTRALAEQIKTLIDKLICSSEMMNKLANQVIRKKALNPLISDELVSLVGTAGSSANNAVALTLVALQAVFAAQASATRSEAALGLAFAQSRDLYAMLTTSDAVPERDGTKETKTLFRGGSLQELLHTAYRQAKTNYDDFERAMMITTAQLNEAIADLNKAQVRLRSLQAGLAAASAAALAS